MYEEMSKRIIEMGGKILFSSEVIKINIKDKNVCKIKYNNGKCEHEIDVDILVSSINTFIFLICSFLIDIFAPLSIKKIVNGKFLFLIAQ